MSLTNITATLNNGVQVVTNAQNKGNNVVATCQDEAMTLNVDSAIVANNTTARININNSIVKINDRDFALSYGTNNLDTNAQVNVTDSMLHWNLTTARKNIRFTSFVRSELRSTKTAAGGLAFVYTQAGNKAVLDSSIFDGIYCHEVSGVPLTFNAVTYKNCGINLLNWEAGDLTVRGVSFGSGTRTGTAYTGADGVAGYTSYDSWLGNGNSANRFRFVDCEINMAKIAINYAAVTGNELCFKSYTRNEKYMLDAITLSGANVQFTPSASSGSSSQAAFNRSVNSNGYLTDGVTEYIGTELLVQNTVDAGTTRSTGLTDPATVRNYTLKNITWTRRTRRADILESVQNVTPTSRVGKSDDPSTANHLRDMNFTGTYTQAAAITGVAFTYNAGTGAVIIDVTAARSVQEIYNAWKHWTSQIAQFSISQSKVTMNSGELTVVGTVNIGVGGSIDGIYVDISGRRSKINITLNQPGARLRLVDQNGTERYNDIIPGTSFEQYYPSGSTGTWVGDLELYGYNPVHFTLDMAGGGLDSLLAVFVPDATVVSPLETVSTWTSVHTVQEIRDWIAYYNQTEEGIRSRIPAILASNSLSVGSISLSAVTGVVNFTGGVLTTGVTEISGDIETTGDIIGSVTGRIHNARLILDAPGVYDLDMYNAGIHFLTNGTYDLRSSDLEGTFTISNAVGTTVTVQPTPTANVINNGPTITLDYHERMMIKSADGIGLSSLIMINGAFYGGNPIAGWNYNNPLRYVDVNSNDNVSIFVHAYGYHPRIISGMGAIPEAANITLVPEAGVDTSLDTVLRDDLSTHFSAGIDGSGSVFLAVNMDMSTYAPEAVINALHFYLVKLGYMAAAGALISNSVDTYRFIEGGLVLNTNKFYGKIADSVTVLPDSGIYLPIYVEVDPAVMAAYPAFKPVKKNSSGLLLSYALWTKQSAQLTQADKISTATIVRSTLSSDLSAISTTISETKTAVNNVADAVSDIIPGATPTEVTTITEEKLTAVETRLLTVLSQ